MRLPRLDFEEWVVYAVLVALAAVAALSMVYDIGLR
jgi:hypothetical protein